MNKYKEDHIESHILEHYIICEKIGSGAYGHVWKVKHKKTYQVYALKKIFLAFQNDVDARRTFRQVAILRKLNHPNIVRLLQVIKAQNDLDLYLLFEHAECDLFTAMNNGLLNEIQRKYIIFQLAKTLKYLHTAGVLHRDLKPSNILLDKSCKIKICDFGLARTLYHYDNKSPIMTQFIATLWYRAPEVLFGSTTYSVKSDLWSLGCVIYELYAQKVLIPGENSVNQVQKMLQFKGYPTKQEMEHINASKLDVLLSHFKIKKKPQHYFFQPNWDRALINLLNGLLKYSPKERWSTQMVLKCQFLSQFDKYEEIIVSPCLLKIQANENVKKNKQFYQKLIYKFFLKNHQSDQLKISFHSQSLSLTKRISNKFNKNSISFHTKLEKIQSRSTISNRNRKKTNKPFHQTTNNPDQQKNQNSSHFKPQNKKYRLFKKENIERSREKSKEKFKEKSFIEIKARPTVKPQASKNLVLKRKGFLK